MVHKRACKALAFFAIAVAASITLAAAQDNSDCNLIVTTGLRNYNIGSSSSSALDTIYSNYCDSSGNSNSASTNVGLKAVIEEIPIGLTFGTADQATAFHNFCKNYQSTFASHSASHTYESTIVEKAYEAFNECVALHEGHVNMKNNVVSLAATTFFFSASVENPLTISGVTVSSNIACSGQDSSGHLTQYSPSTHISSTKTLSLYCKRTPQAISGGEYFDEGTISIATNAGNYDVFLPHDTKFSVGEASQLNKLVQETQAILAAKITTTNDRISNIKLTESPMSWLPEFACSQEAIATQPLTFAMGSRDGTSCGVPNRVYVKTLSLSVPPSQ